MGDHASLQHEMLQQQCIAGQVSFLCGYLNTNITPSQHRSSHATHMLQIFRQLHQCDDTKLHYTRCCKPRTGHQKLQATCSKSRPTLPVQLSVHPSTHPRILSCRRACNLLALALLGCPGPSRLWGRRWQQQVRGECGHQHLQVLAELSVVCILDALEHEAPAAASLLSSASGNQLAPVHLEVLSCASLKQSTQQAPVIPTAPFP